MIRCTSCERTFDTTGYPPGYTFRCHCGQVIQTPGGSGASQSHDALESGQAQESQTTHSQDEIDSALDALEFSASGDQHDAPDDAQGSVSDESIMERMLDVEEEESQPDHTLASQPEQAASLIQDLLEGQQTGSGDFDAVFDDDDDEEIDSAHEPTAVAENPLLLATSGAFGGVDHEEEEFEGPADEATAIAENPLLVGPPGAAFAAPDAHAAQPPAAGPLQDAPAHPPRYENATYEELPSLSQGPGTPTPTPAGLPHFPSSPSAPSIPQFGPIAPGQVPPAADVPPPAAPVAPAAPAAPEPGLQIDLSSLPADSGELIPVRTEPRAILALVLIPMVLLGPFVLLLGALSLRRILQQPELFRGRILAFVCLFFGISETILLGLFSLLFFLPPERVPLAPQFFALLKLPSEHPRFFLSQDGKQGSILQKDLALSLIYDELKKNKADKTSEVGTLYVFQEQYDHHAYAHWYDAKQRKLRRSRFEYSNRKQWHLAHLDAGRGYEVRCSLLGPGKLPGKMARLLIQQFWKLRGRFSHVKIEKLYVHQDPERHTAVAYWKLSKQPPQKPRRTWFVQSLFHHSNGKRWYLSRYAIPTAEDEEYSFSKKGPRRIDMQAARELLTNYHTANTIPFSPSRLFLVQKASHIVAYAHWKNTKERKTHRSLFRFSNSNFWFLARPKVSSGGLLNFSKPGPPRLDATLAKQILLRYLSSKKKTVLIRKLYVYQPPQSQIAYVRWLSHQRNKKGSVHQTVFLRSNKGEWFLSKPSTKTTFHTRFFRKGGAQLTPKLAKAMIQEFWREDEQERFTGAVMLRLYIYQPDNKPVAWAHWVMERNKLVTRMRTKFFRSNSGEWFLGRYDIGRGYYTRFQLPGPERLPTRLASRLLRKYLQTTKHYKRAEIVALYVHQPRAQPQAYVRWVRFYKGTYTPTRSLFHRTAKGAWSLSLPQMQRVGSF